MPRISELSHDIFAGARLGGSISMLAARQQTPPFVARAVGATGVLRPSGTGTPGKISLHPTSRLILFAGWLVFVICTFGVSAAVLLTVLAP